MNHRQKAGEIHSLAWIPQSIHMAFFALGILPETCECTHTYINKQINKKDRKIEHKQYIPILFLLLLHPSNGLTAYTLFSVLLKNFSEQIQKLVRWKGQLFRSDACVNWE